MSTNDWIRTNKGSFGDCCVTVTLHSYMKVPFSASLPTTQPVVVEDIETPTLASSGRCSTSELYYHIWNRYPDSNWSWKFCRLLPYHLAIPTYSAFHCPLRTLISERLFSAFLPFGASDKNRTCNPLLTRQVLYLLSYTGNRFRFFQGAKKTRIN